MLFKFTRIYIWKSVVTINNINNTIFEIIIQVFLIYEVYFQKKKGKSNRVEKLKWLNLLSGYFFSKWICHHCKFPSIRWRTINFVYVKFSCKIRGGC